MVDRFSAEERETIITASDASHVVLVWTAQRAVINKLRRHPAFTEVATGFHGSSEWSQFTTPAGDWNPATGAKRRRTLTPEQREALADQARKNLGK